MNESWELTDKEIRSCKASELIIYREEDITAHPPDRTIARAAQKKLAEWLDREKLHKGIGHIGIEVGRWPNNKPEFNPDCPHCKWQALCKTLGVK